MWTFAEEKKAIRLKINSSLGQARFQACWTSPQHSVPRYGSACPQSDSDLGGRFQIKITIKSEDQKTADFVIEKDVRARATATA
ncbi:hypothetical protein [Pseudomonas sp. Xaverov 259]|uniref:hypothetical protein n=1 Tax=Pseudomonas sp. Xaverov 259 TaxID=2666086 RepID=UPI001C5AE6A5|nr:hypothetical protein [Pseudomonas sp. Xaverov 259]